MEEYNGCSVPQYTAYPLLIAYNMNQQRIFSVQATIPLDDLKNLVINAYLAA